MVRRLASSTLPFVALAFLALPAAGESFVVTLTDGTTFETRYQPQEASWDPTMVLLMTEVGNWIGLPADSIAEVTSDIDTEGFGTRINATTIALGFAPNDAAIPEEEGGAAGGAAAAQSQQNALLEAYLQQRAAEESYTVEQFVEPGETMGIPSRFVGPPSGGGGGSLLPFPQQ